jgi:hypothetical protein
MNELAAEPAPSPQFRKFAPLVRGTRLSEAPIWSLLRRYYIERGPDAWQRDGIPYFVTSNPRIADVYARVIAGFLRELTVAGEDAQPVYIVELAAGIGRFGHSLLQRLRHHRRHPALARIPIKYVMTDVAERNLDMLSAHPRLRPFIEEGLLDMAVLDADDASELRLRHSGEVISPGTLRHPVVFIANYLFDSLPQDAFRLVGGVLHESLVTIDPQRVEPDPTDPALLSRIDLTFEHRPAAEDYYEDPAWNRLLADYRDRLPDAGFLFPVGALHCLRRLHELAGGRLLLLSGDKGYSDDKPIALSQGEPSMALHGESCFSMMVDYQLIGGYVAGLGGSAQHHTRPGESLSISAFSLGVDAGEEQRFAFTDAFEWFGADDAFNFGGFASADASRGLFPLLAVLRMSGWDSIIFERLLPAIQAVLPTLSEAGKDEIRRAATLVWDSYFPIKNGSDVAFALGMLLLDLDFHAEASSFFQHSIDSHGVAPGTAFNTALCAFHLGQPDAAAQWLDCALALDPGLDAARRLRARLAQP